MFTSIPQNQSSQRTLDQLYEHDDFMLSISTLVDLGCGSGHDLEWWATRTTREEENPEPLNIKCVGVDLHDSNKIAKKYLNVTYQKANFENEVAPPGNQLFDVLWCYDAFQYALNPIETLSHWRSISSDGAMLVISVPDTIFIKHRQLSFIQPAGCYYHHTMVSLIHMLALTGWDCKGGFFSKRPGDPWIQAIVYKSEHEPMDPRTTTWHQLSEMKLLPDSADASVYAHNYLRQQDLLVPWIDRSLIDMSQQ
jgi:SAM-dependent methyltransferase